MKACFQPTVEALLVLLTMLLGAVGAARASDGYIVKACALYKEPSDSSQEIKKLAKHTILDDIGKRSPDGQFVWVEIDNNGPDIKGWVKKSCVLRTDD